MNTSYFAEKALNAKRFVDLSKKRHYRNISVNESGLLSFEAYNLMQSCYESHSLDLLYDFQQVIDILTENRLECLVRDKEKSGSDL